MLQLSAGGEDAVSLREFDLQTGRFVAGGFDLHRGKQGSAWISGDELLVAREWVAGELTESGVITSADLDFRRRSCCLFYRTPGGSLCCDCAVDEPSMS